jgi:hypothetical protein
MNVETAVTPTLRSRLAALPGEVAVRLALRLDAVISGANGVVYLAIPGALDSALGVDAGVIRGFGAFFVVSAATVWAISSREPINRTAVRVVIVGNAAYAVASLAVLAAGLPEPETAGALWIALQALIVGGFAALQAAALRRP